jgi:hypothetical protein
MKTPGLWKGTASQGAMPAMGVKLEIEEIERTETGPNSQVPGSLAYKGHFRVAEPKKYKGRKIQDFFTIGTKEDKRAKKEETWDRPEGGPGKLLRLMEKAGVPQTEDDDEWRPAAEGAVVYAHLRQDMWEGSPNNKIAGYFAEDDEDFVGVGEELSAPAAQSGARGGRKKARGDEPRSARGRKREDDEGDDDDKDKDEEEEETETKSARSSKKRDDDDEDAEPKRAAASARGRRSRDEDEE